MTKKTKQLIVAVIAVLVVGIAAWAVINYQTKRKKIEQYNLALAEQFDKTMAVAYPLLDNYALSLSDKADSIDAMGRKAMETDSTHYKDAFYRFWQQYKLTKQSQTAYILSEEYQYFRISPVFKLLMSTGEKRQKETEAIQKITWAGQMLLDPVSLRYDSLLSTTRQARQFLSDGLEVITPYHNENTNIHAWRNIR